MEKEVPYKTEEYYSQKIKESADHLFATLVNRVSAYDLARVRDAYNLASEAHSSQRRKTGEPYIIHPIAVARIIAEELELGANPVIAALLHDVVEDTDTTIDDIRNRFGDDVAFLVGVVTKQKKDKYDFSKQVDNFRQILASVQFDIRAILIKLADRLHNMRTLDSMRPDKQMKIAGETDYFYAPLANRLGLYHVKSELENLSFRYRCPREYAALDARLQKEKSEKSASIEEFCNKVQQLLMAQGINVRIEVRYRTLYSIWRKMQSAECDFQHIDDKHYTRIIYDTESIEQEKKMSLRIYSVLTDTFKERPGSVANYINAPKENGYQSFHVKLLNAQGVWEEVHISSERMTRNSRLGCAAERTEGNVKSWLVKFKAVLKDVAYHNKEMEYMDGVTSSFYNDDIMVFTPKGQSVILPKGATALDFAYEILGNDGRKATYARINGKLSSVITVLQRGDCVEIGTTYNAIPDPAWMAHVLTYKAKRNLRSCIAMQPTAQYKCCQQCHPLPGDEVIGFRSPNGTITMHKRNCHEAIKLASQYGDSIVSVNFEENRALLYPVRIHIRGIDRYHLLRDIIDCITEKQNLSITKLTTSTTDHIAECTIEFPVHSAGELQEAINSIAEIPNVDEVYRVSLC